MQFRAYFVDHNNHIRGAVDIDAPTLDLAKTESSRLAGDFVIELWQLDHCVCRIEPMPATAAPRRQPNHARSTCDQGDRGG